MRQDDPIFEALITELYECQQQLYRVGFFYFFQMTIYEDSVAAHLTKILNSDEHAVVISSAK